MQVNILGQGGKKSQSSGVEGRGNQQFNKPLPWVNRPYNGHTFIGFHQAAE
jgi:hypothetical protein